MKSMSKLLRVACALLAIGIASSCYGQSTTAAQGDEALVLRTYEIGDLVFAVPDYALAPSPNSGVMRVAPAFGGSGGMGGGGMSGGGGGIGGMSGGMGQGEARRSSNPAPITVDSICDVITMTVEPSSWNVNGGGDARVSPLGTTLVVLQTVDAQGAISGLLESLRDGSASRRTMTIDARWLLLDSDGLARLQVKGENGESTINREALAEFTRQPTSLRGFISCFSGQSVFLTSGTVRTNVSSYIPVVGSVEPPKPEVMFATYGGDKSVSFVADQQGGPFGGRGVGYQPVTTTNNFGVQVELRPTRLHPEEAAAIDLRSTITFPASPLNPGEVEPTTSSLAPQVDRVAIQTQELATTLKVPLGEPVLVGGMTDMAPRGATADAAGGAAGDGGEKPQLYVILEVR